MSRNLFSILENLYNINRKEFSILEIINRIEMLLKQKNKSKSDLCEFLGLKNPTFSHWKSGANTSYKKYLPQIAEFLNVSIDYLLGREKNKTLGNNAEGLDFSLNTEPSILMLHEENRFPFEISPDDIKLTAKEIQLVKAYRTKLEMRNSVDILLGINEQPDLSEDMEESITQTAHNPINKK